MGGAEETKMTVGQTVGQNGEDRSALEALIGHSPAVVQLREMIRRVARSNASVMLCGPSGSGKELVARAIHDEGVRSGRAFSAINCGAIPADLIESELFGHEKGSFTGAHARRIGHFEASDGGTLFLDEIGDMPFDLQTRLLRVLSDGQFYRVGGHQPLKSNVRVIAATHQHLEERVRQGSFREDLFHRLNVIRLRLPALRERREDIPALARHFLQKSAKDLGVEPKRIADDAMAEMSRFVFPGNVRQLENVCHWLTVMAPAQVVELKDLPPELLDGMPGDAFTTMPPPASPAPFGLSAAPAASPAALPPAAPTTAADAVAASFDAGRDSERPLELAPWLGDLEREARRLLEAGQPQVWDALTRQFEGRLIHTALAVTRGRRIEAAQRLGIGRNTITRKIQELGLDD